MSELSLIVDLEAGGALTPVGLRLPPMISLERCEAVGVMLGRVEQMSKWALGDWLLFVEDVFPQEASQLSEAIGISEASRQQYARAAERIEQHRRRPALSWSHHRLVLPLEPAEQDDWLRRAEDGNWTKRELEERMHPSNGQQPRGRQYVVEHVAKIAERLLEAAEPIQDGYHYVVPGPVIEDLREALGE